MDLRVKLILRKMVEVSLRVYVSRWSLKSGLVEEVINDITESCC